MAIRPSPVSLCSVRRSRAVPVPGVGSVCAGASTKNAAADFRPDWSIVTAPGKRSMMPSNKFF
jgi:hypothetical protein